MWLMLATCSQANGSLLLQSLQTLYINMANKRVYMQRLQTFQ